MPKPQGKMPGKLEPVLRLGPAPGSELQQDPGWAQELGQGSKSMSALKLGPGVEQMMLLEPKSACGLGPGPSEKLEPETTSELNPVVFLVPKAVSGLE